MAASKCILCILKIDLILFYDAPNTVFIISSTASSKKTQVKEGVTRHVNHFSMSSACNQKTALYY